MKFMPLVRIDLRKQKDSAYRQQIDRDVDGALVGARRAAASLRGVY
jgi:hypothetical protein